jgi:lipid II:glycine glycyltransferase (peptidoglycan interpeptide bridge formation enzyme)
MAAHARIAASPWWESVDAYYRFFIAADELNVLGTLGTYRWNGVVTEFMSERTMPARERKLPVQDLLHLHAFRTHRALGDQWFDLAGFNPDPASVKEVGIRRFKEKWQGETIEVPRLEKGVPPFLYSLLLAMARRSQ